MDLRSLHLTQAGKRENQLLGTLGHLAIFFWFLGMVMLVPVDKILATTLICLAVGCLVYPRALRGVLRLRWLVLMLLLAVPPLFFLGELDSTAFGVRYSSEGSLAGLQIGMRFVVVMMAVQGFTASVDIPALAGLLERVGLQGLGFTSGVALNLLPYIQQSSLNAWRSLRMRGGLRRHWRQGLRLLVMTVATNSLQRAEEVALAAEGRAFSPDKSRPMPIRKGSLDWILVVTGLATLILMIFI